MAYNEVKKVTMEDKNKKSEKACKNVDEQLWGARSIDFWKIIKIVRSTRKEKIKSYIQDREWTHYFTVFDRIESALYEIERQIVH